MSFLFIFIFFAQNIENDPTANGQVLLRCLFLYQHCCLPGYYLAIHTPMFIQCIRYWSGITKFTKF